MTTVRQNVVAVGAAVLGSLLFMVALNRIWPWEKRRTHNDVIGWELTVLGTTYAVILGFMLYAVWANLEQAELNVDLEANGVVDVYRLAGALPEPQRTQLQTLARSYVDSVIDQEWPEMARGQLPRKGTEINGEMWKTVTSVQAASPMDANAQEHVMSELSSLEQHRLTRIQQSTDQLPNMLWLVLLLGGSLAIISASMFGAQNVRLQAVQVFCFSLLVSLSLAAISDIHRPFRGLIHVSDSAFQRAAQIMDVH